MKITENWKKNYASHKGDKLNWFSQNGEKKCQMPSAIHATTDHFYLLVYLV